jgi:AraC-like DNA-binding protein
MEQKNYIIQKLNFDRHTNRIFSSGKYYLVILISKGGCQFELDHNLIFCNTESAVFLKPKQKIEMHYSQSKYPLEIITLQILPSHLNVLSDETCKLEDGFSFIPRSTSIIRLDVRATTLIKNVAKTLMSISKEKGTYGQQLYEQNLLSILLILFLRSCIASDHVMLSHSRKHLIMDDIFLYIREHLTDDLSLETLEKQFYVSRYHICREFKRLTGQTLHAYIVKSRLSLCKKHIESGKSIKEVYELGGFSGYNHFFRAFKKEYGMTPKEYYESLTK